MFAHRTSTICLTKKAEPPPTRDVNRDSGTASANGGWLRRLVRPLVNVTESWRESHQLSACLCWQAVLSPKANLLSACHCVSDSRETDNNLPSVWKSTEPHCWCRQTQSSE